MRKLVIAAACAALFGPAIGQAAEYGRVVSATPVVASVPVARQACTDGAAVVQPRTSGVGAVLGAIAGGVVGNAFGNGFGRMAATGAGVVAGAAIGDNVEAGADAGRAVAVQRCQTGTAYEPRTVGYDVTYEYAGQRYTTRLPRDPGPTIALDVRPAGMPESGGPLARDDRAAYPGGAVPLADRGADGGALEAPEVQYLEPGATVYYGPPAVYIAPSIGIGYYGYGRGWGHRGGRWR